MHVFKDSAGREWSLAITIGTVKRVKAATGILITDAVDFAWLQELLADAIKFNEVLWAIVKPAADKIPITQDQFDDAVAGEVRAAAMKSFSDALVDFSHPLIRGAIKEMLEAIPQGQSAIAEQVVTEIRARLAKLKEKPGTSSAGGLPGSSESTPPT